MSSYSDIEIGKNVFFLLRSIFSEKIFLSFLWRDNVAKIVEIDRTFYVDCVDGTFDS